MINILPTKSSSRVLILAIILSSQLCHCIRFFLQPDSRRCLKDDMYANQLAVGEYEISELVGTKVDISVMDTKGNIAFTREDINGRGKFAITSDSPDTYEFCLVYTSQTEAQVSPREVSINYRIGADAKEFDPDITDKFALIEEDLSRIETYTNSMIIDFAGLKKRGREMRSTNESTNRRLFYLTITSVLVVLALAFWQVLYFRQFFKTRKMID